MKQALHIKNLTKKYKDFTLDHISLDLPYGMILGLIGENGSGKFGLIVYIFIAMLFGGIYGAVSSLKGMEFLMAGDKTMIFIIGIPIGILFVVISFFLSLACYKKRYS